VRGEVIGINAAIASETGYNAGYGFAIPINLARTVMTQLIAAGHVERAVIGVRIRAITPEDAENAKLPDIRGVVVNDFGDDSPAKRAGIQEGDVIVAVDGQSIESVPQLQQRIGFKKPGETVQVTVVRTGGVRRTIPVRVQAAPLTEPEIASSNESTSRREAPPMEEKLGISVQPLSQENARDPSLRAVMRFRRRPRRVSSIPDGPSHQHLIDDSQGILPDIILKVNGQATRTRAELREILSGVKSAQIVTLTVLSISSVGWVQRVVRIRAK
jgi:serine protease Do